MKITREEVLRVAELAYLELAESEVETMRRQLDSILTYIEKLNELDTSKVEPLAQVGVPYGEAAALREDQPVPCDLTQEALAGAPDASPPYFRVPRVLER